jgi:hypothetical protein
MVEGQVVGRVGPPCRGELGEVAEISSSAPMLSSMVPRCSSSSSLPNQFLRPAQHRGEVRFGHANSSNVMIMYSG